MTPRFDKKIYSALLVDTLPRVIRTEAENDRALALIGEMMDRGDDLTPEESEMMKLLVALVQQFEDDHYDLPRSSPNDVLQELMAARNLKQKDVVALFPSKGIASEVLAGKRGISKAQAKRLAEFFHVSPALFV